MDFRVGGEERGADLDQGGLGSGNLEVVQQRGGEPLIHQDAAMLGIIAKLDDIPMAVIRLEQMRLSASSHFSHMPDGRKRHREERAVT